MRAHEAKSEQGEASRERRAGGHGSPSAAARMQDALGNRRALALYQALAEKRLARKCRSGCGCASCAPPALPMPPQLLGAQLKARVSAPGDPLEREADALADRLVDGHDAAPTAAASAGGAQQKPRDAGAASGGERGLAAPARDAAVEHLGGGHALPAMERAFFEPRLGDLGGVRIHTGDDAAATASTVNARAFTLGRDIVFGAGEWRPGTVAGRRLLAHELVHYVQQGGGAGRGVVQRQERPIEIDPETLPRPEMDPTDPDYGRGLVRRGLGRYIEALAFHRIINDCPSSTGVRLADILLQVQGMISGHRACLDEFARLGDDPIRLLTAYRAASFTIDPAVTTSGHVRCPGRGDPTLPPQAPVIQLGASLCSSPPSGAMSPHIHHVIVHELAHLAGCRPDPVTGLGNATSFDETVANHVADVCVGDAAARSAFATQARAVSPTAAEDWDFTAVDMLALQLRGGTLTFASDSDWFPAALRTNLRNTLLFMLVPRTDAARTGGVNPRDLFHGHVVVPRAAAASSLTGARDRWRADLLDTRARVLDASGQVTGANLAAWRTEVQRLAAAATPLLDQVVGISGAAVIYHSYEFPERTAPEYSIPGGDPRRNTITPLGTNTPSPYTAPDINDASSYMTGSSAPYTHIFQFSFLIDRDGVIHVRPELGRELSDVTGTPMVEERPR